MQIHTRHAIRAALLSLLIAASFLTTGGWFCADGRACLPALSPTCCCGDEREATPAAAAPCDGAGCPDRLTEGSCGCYQDLPALASMPAAGLPLIAAPTLLPASLAAVAPPVPDRVPAPASESPPPPRFRVSPRDLRAPPAA